MTTPQLLSAEPKLQQVFERYRNRPWVFLRPMGNWGDHLIFAGAESMANALGLQWTSCETPEFQSLTTTSAHCIYLQGGGGYNSWGSGRAFVNLEMALARPVHLVVQGPVSTEGNREWLGIRFRSALSVINCREFLFYAREESTLELLNSLHLQDLGATVYQDHDTALALKDSELLTIAGLSAMPAGNYDLVVLREDNEQPACTAGDHVKTAAPATGIALDPAYVATSFAHWVRIHLHAKSITTNRLHSSIAGAISGKPVTIGPGSYHKNRSVWQCSLKDRGVRWTDQIEPPSTFWWQLLPQRVRDSHKVGRLRLAIHGVPLR